MKMKTQEESQYKIFIDSSQRRDKKIELRLDDKVIDEISGDIDLVPSMRELLDRNKLTIEDIKGVNVNRGPGSFTGLKLGVTISNIINWALGKKKINELDVPEYGSEPNISQPKQDRI